MLGKCSQVSPPNSTRRTIGRAAARGVHRAAFADRVGEGVEPDLGEDPGPARGHVAVHVEEDARGDVVGGDAVLDEHPPDLGHRQRRGPAGVGAGDDVASRPSLARWSTPLIPYMSPAAIGCSVVRSRGCPSASNRAPMAASTLSGQPSAEEEETVTTAPSGMRAAAASGETSFEHCSGPVVDAVRAAGPRRLADRERDRERLHAVAAVGRGAARAPATASPKRPTAARRGRARRPISCSPRRVTSTTSPTGLWVMIPRPKIEPSVPWTSTPEPAKGWVKLSWV